MSRFARWPVYYLKTALEGLRRNLALNLVAVLTIGLALMILGAFAFLHVNLERVVVSSTQALSFSIYLKDGLAPRDIEETRRKVSEIPGARSVTLVTKEQALADLRNRLGNQSGLLDGLDENPLPASLELILAPDLDRRRLPELTARLSALPGVDDVSFAWDWADKLKALVRFVNVGGLVMGGLLFLAIVFIIAGTIRLTVVARRDELYILRLMGATESFVRTPFILEGVFQGLLGGLLALSGLASGHLMLATQIQLPLGLSLIRLVFLPLSWSLGLVLVGGLLGFLGSFLSLSRRVGL